MSQINQIPNPALPYAVQVYHPAFMDQYSQVLRLYFNQMTGAMNNILGTNGGQFIDCPNGLFFNTADQTFAATGTGYPVVYNQTYLSNAVQLRSGSTSQIEVLIGGVYNFQYSGQAYSTSGSPKDLYLWIKRNGIAIGYSTHVYTLDTNNHAQEINWNFNIDLAAGEYLELEVAVSDTNVRLDAVAPTSPHPGVPSSVMTVNFIAPLPVPRPTAP